MTQRQVSHPREEALVRLLDDPSPTVQKALEKEFSRLGRAGMRLLKDAYDESASREVQDNAERILSQLRGPHPAAELIGFIRSLEYELENGLYLINRIVEPGLTMAEFRQPIDRIAERVAELTSPPISAWEQCRVMNRVLFHELGYRGNIEDYEDPANSFLSSVLERRKGLPITLSCLYILIGSRSGFDLEPIALPGHFLVGCFHSTVPFYIDPFDRGRVRSAQDLRFQMEEAEDEKALQWLAPCPVGEVLCRVCRNLVVHFQVKNDLKMSRQFSVFVREFEETYRRHSQT